ncbi:MAG: Crp/Fnr family transcriptional regulator [Bacteroidales bacterium]
MSALSSSKINNCHECKDISCAAAVLKISELELVNLNSLENDVKRGEIIVHEGSMTSHVVYLKSGLVKEFIRQADGKEQILQIVKKHSYLGLPSLFSDRINHYSYAALEDCKICHIDMSVFNYLIRQNGEFAQQILISVSKDSLNNFNRFIRQSHKKIYGRVADALLYFAQIVFESHTFELPFTRQEFADLIGLSRESATRVLIKFKEESLITIKGKKITINDLDLLDQISVKG